MILKKILLVPHAPRSTIFSKGSSAPRGVARQQGLSVEAKEATMEVEAGGYMRRDFKDLSPESKETAREDGVLEARPPDGESVRMTVMTPRRVPE